MSIRTCRKATRPIILQPEALQPLGIDRDLLLRLLPLVDRAHVPPVPQDEPSLFHVKQEKRA